MQRLLPRLLCTVASTTAGLRTKPELERWMERGAAYARSLAPKRARS